MASASPSWVILYKAPREARPGGAISLVLAAPPRVTRLDVGPGIFPADPDRLPRVLFPRILTIDPSGLVLAIAPPSKSERTYKPAYLVLDVPSATATRVPGAKVLNGSNLGVITAPGCNNGYMVVDLRNIVGGNTATLACFSSETREWVNKTVANPLPNWNWSFKCVTTHDGKLWWADCTAGILACDPFADNPDMAYVPLPRGEDPDEPHHENCSFCYSEIMAASQYRCVNLSNGKFRYVEMGCASEGKVSKLTMHTLTDPATAEWTLEYQVGFDEIWAGDSYKATRLPENVPDEIALVHPKNPDVVYFFLEEYIFGVDVPARKVVECAPHELDITESEGGPSCVLAWELPPIFNV
ncbi:hypothetical protein PR202_ga26573 [Eleusine coracana subsp. coracana]|uniref:DUF1618 domain-containing protein n=1 Tax=Eleusine coracana subsp. coracana TaxID=191504 RepID=A0AAV5DEF6_ELECO|nr:hypothetical protein QOZ80_3AG0239030 [Eleusine coracana subsp. coracana]GJN08631.1 hypothetical protein PR202_ga26573 [Eleusine coracana subsp. coracana]